MRLLAVPGVFRPRSDSRLLARVAAERTPRGGSVLDPFTGSGILAIAAARAGAGRVTAIDLSRRAVGCAWANARLNGVRVRALRGDMFEPIDAERFDLIVANPPYLPAAVAHPRGAARAWEAGPDGRAQIDRLCRDARSHLQPGGEVLMVHSSVCGLDATLGLLGGSGLEPELVARVRGPLGPLLSARAAELERRGLLAAGEREEELLVISGVCSS